MHIISDVMGIEMGIHFKSMAPSRALAYCITVALEKPALAWREISFGRVVKETLNLDPYLNIWHMSLGLGEKSILELSSVSVDDCSSGLYLFFPGTN